MFPHARLTQRAPARACPLGKAAAVKAAAETAACFKAAPADLEDWGGWAEPEACLQHVAMA